MKTGTSLPASCSVGDMYLNTGGTNPGLYACTVANTWSIQSGLADPGANGLVKRTAANTTTIVAAPSGSLVGTSDTQTLTNKSIDASEINSGIFAASRLPALSGDVVAAAGTGVTSLANVNSNPGTFGDATHIAQFTVDAKGRITSVSQVNAQGGSAGVTATAGTFSAIPATCPTGSLYLATDQPVAQQLYTCSSGNTWSPVLSVGPSGALAVSNGSIDVVTSIVPRLSAANTFTGLNAFSSGIRFTPTTSQPNCDVNGRGMFWFLNNGASKDGVQVCVYNGSAYAWVALY